MAEAAPTPQPPRTRGLRLPFVLARVVARTAARTSRASGRGGTALPGKLLLRLSPGAMARLARQRDEQVVLVSATNGKTTLTAMLSAICSAGGRRVVHNLAGANLRSGIASTLLLEPAGDTALLETDEAALPSVARDVDPTVLVLGNLFRDQLDRHGELDAIGDRWRVMLEGLDPGRTSVACNADDPQLATLVLDWVERRAAGATAGTGDYPPHVVWFGMDDPAVGAPGVPHAADSTFCRRCATPLDFATSWVGHLGDWSCPGCGLRRPPLDVAARRVVVDGLASSRFAIEVAGAGDGAVDAAGAAASPGGGAGAIDVKLRIPGLYNVYNALAAAAGAVALGVPLARVREGLDATSPAFGRFERVPVPGVGTVTLLLVKNPTGLNEVVRTLVASGVDLGATLFALNDGIADGRDTSWIWDADIEPLLDAVPSMLVTGDRAAEFALRAVYGGVEPSRLQVEPELDEALFALVARAKEFSAHGHAYALVTYTAMLRMRATMRAQGWVSTGWRVDPGHADAQAASTGTGSASGPSGGNGR